MPLPERMKPARVTRKQMKELVSQLNGILDHIDNGMDENNEEGVRLENGKYPTLSLFFVQTDINCA